MRFLEMDRSLQETCYHATSTQTEEKDSNILPHMGSAQWTINGKIVITSEVHDKKGIE